MANRACRAEGVWPELGHPGQRRRSIVVSALEACLLIAAARNRPEAVPDRSVRSEGGDSGPQPPISASTCFGRPGRVPAPVRIEALSKRTSSMSCLTPNLDSRATRQRSRIRRWRTDLSSRRPGGSLFIVASGAVKLVRPSPRGDNAVVSVLGPGDTFGTLTRIEHCGETAVDHDRFLYHQHSCSRYPQRLRKASESRHGRLRRTRRPARTVLPGARTALCRQR